MDLGLHQPGKIPLVVALVVSLPHTNKFNQQLQLVSQRSRQLNIVQHMLVGITQGTSYQTGRYLIIHDNTTPTILEESALATGDMIATFDATIAGGNLTVRVNMSNAGLATVAVKMDTIKSDSSS